jgi:hypothetical protein
VRLGHYCRSNGLRQDPRTIIGPTPDLVNERLKALVEQDAAVKRAAADYERLQAAADEETSKWEVSALAFYSAKQRRFGKVEHVVVDGQLTQWTPPGTPTLADLSRLDEAENQAQHLRDHAGEKAIKARQALDTARAKARRRLSHQAS